MAGRSRGRSRRGGGRGRGGITISIEGLDRLRDRLGELPDEIVDALRRAVKESAEDVQRETLVNTRRNTGHLQRTLQIKYLADGLRAEVGWFDPTSYYAKFQEFGTSQIPAHPALGPAIEAERRRIRDRITREVRQELGL